MMAQHIIINRTSETVLRFLPPYILERKHVDTAIAALDEILTASLRRVQHEPAKRRQENIRMGSKTVVMIPSPTQLRSRCALPRAASLGIQSDTAFSEAAKRLCGRDLCSIGDLTVEEMAAIMELAHAVKNHPEDFRHALDARQMVLFFEKASLRTRLTFEAAINTLGGNAIFVDQTQSPLGERESSADMARNLERWMSVIVLRTYSHDTITEMAA